MTSAYAIPRRSDGAVILPRAQEVTLFNYDFSLLSALPPELTGGGSLAAGHGGGYMAVWTDGTAGSSMGVNSETFDMSAFAYIWVKVQLRVISGNKGDDSRINLGMNGASHGVQWYTNSGQFNSLGGDDPIYVGPLYDFTTSRAAYRDVGILIFPGKKVAAATEGNKIINAAYFPNMVFGAGDAAGIVTKGALADVKRMDILKWSCVGGRN